MKISTKGRYAVRVMIDLASQPTGENISLKRVASRQAISEKYLEMIVGMLVKEKLLISTRGKSGGYRLAKEASEYTILEILEAVEGSLAPVTCLVPEENDCQRYDSCSAIFIWEELYAQIRNYLRSVTLEDAKNNGIKSGSIRL